MISNLFRNKKIEDRVKVINNDIKKEKISFINNFINDKDYHIFVKKNILKDFSMFEFLIINQKIKLITYYLTAFDEININEKEKGLLLAKEKNNNKIKEIIEGHITDKQFFFKEKIKKTTTINNFNTFFI